MPKHFQGSFLRPPEPVAPKKVTPLGAGGITSDGQKYQGIYNLHHDMGLHQMNKNDSTFDQKRKMRIEDVFEKDMLLKQMKEDGFTNFKQDAETHFQ